MCYFPVLCFFAELAVFSMTGRIYYGTRPNVRQLNTVLMSVSIDIGIGIIISCPDHIS